SRGDQSGAHWIERIIFADGSEIGQRDIEQLIYDAEATSGSDELHNFGAPSSGFGNDNGTVLDGGAGNDRYINSFDDIYVRLGQGSGSDLIVNGDKVGVTVHVKLDGLTFEDVAVFEEFRNERDVTVVRTRFGDELVIEGKLEQQGIELRFEDGAGQVQFVSEIGAVESPVSANDQTDFLNGAVIGGGGEFGSPEPVDDTFLPGGGDDYIFGKGGLDTVEINFLGNGLDHLITSNQGRFQIVLGPDFSRDDFTYSWLGDGSDNVLLSFNDLGDGVIVSAQAIVGVEYADGITISFDTSGTGNVTELFPGAAIFFNPSEDSVYEALNGDVTITLSSLSGNDTFLDSYLSSNGAIAPVPPPGWETNTLRLIDGSALNDFEFVRDTSSPEDMVVRNLATGSSIRVEGQFAGESLDLGSVWTAAPLDALGNPDWSQVDLDADGEAEFARLDTDGDSVPNWANPDADGDGTADWESYTETVLDADGDGIIDLYAYDDNDDGTYDAFWLQGGLPPGEGIYFYDTDGDNIVDHYDGFTDYDLPLPLNPDGSVDWDAIDEDGNGVPDIAIIDFDGDGAPDWDAPDIDQDGTVDWTIMSFEEFYVSDPFVYVSRYTDLASGLTTYAVQNGNFSLLARDTDGDGTPDEFAFDDDYDLVPDTPQINYVFGRVELHLEQPDGSITTEFYDWQDISGALVERNESAGGQDFTINLYASRPVPTAGDDVLSVAPNETIDGLAGNDMIFADDGRATILFGIGSGSDVLIQKNINNFIDNNEVELAGVFALEDLIVLQSADGRDLVVEIAASGDRLRIVDQLARDSDENHHPVVTSFILNSGEVVSWKTMLSLISGIDTAGDGVIVGSSEGAVLNGGEGNDSLFGGPGDDIYDFGRSYDEDVIRDSGGNDIVRLADGIGFSDLYFSRTGNKGSDLLVEVMGLDRLALTIKGQFSDGNARIEAFELADGTTIGWRDVQTFILDQERTGNDDEIAGFETSDIISGGSGNDVLTGLRGDDLILGGSGRDAAVFRGSQGQYTISTVDGMTTVTDLVAGRDGTDTLEDVEDLIFEGDGTQVALVAPNSAPTATNTSVSGTEDEDVVIARADFLALAGDADGDALQLSVGNGANGRAWIGLDGDIYFRPDANFNGTASFDYTVADGNGGTATGLVSIDVAAVNDAPELSEAFDDQTFFEDEPVSFAVPADLFVDPDGDAVDISVRQANSDPLPSWLTYAGGLVEGTPPADFNGAFDLEVVGSDGQATTSTGFTLTILARNDAPEIVTPLANSEVVPGQQLSMAISESNYFDVEGDPLALEVLLASGDPLPSWLTYANGLLQGTVPADFVDTLSLVVLISDGKATIGEYFDIAPAENVAPVVALALSNVSVDEDTAVSIAIPADAFTDPDGDTLAYTAQLADGSALPGWLSFDGSTFTGTPPADFNGEFEIEVTASDGALSVSDTFVLTVNPVNDAPVIAIALADVSSDEDTPVSITVPGDAFVDVDGDTLTFTATLVDDSSLPAWLTFDGTTFTGTPPANFNGIVDIKVTASDGSLSVSDIFSLTIVPENDAPVLDNPLVDVSSDEDQPVNVVLPADAFSDPDGDALTYTARLADGGVLPGWLTFDGSAFTGTPPADFNGELDIEVTASDGALSVSDTLRLTINPVNDAPAVALTLTDQTVDGSANVDFAVPIGSFTDVDGDTLSYSATLADGSALPAWLSFDAGTQSFSGTAPNVDATLNIRVTASDGALSVFDDFTLTVEADGTGEGSTGGFSFANLNSWYNPSWGGGYNVTFDYTVQADAILDGELMAWDIIASYDGPGTIVNGWLSGFPGSASFVFDADSATFSTVGQSYQPDLTEGSTFQLSLQIDDAPYTEGEFDFVIFDRDPPLNLADAGDTEIEPALTNDWGTGLTQDVVLENTSSVLIDEWHVILDTPDGVDIDITNVWGATATELANGDIRFDPLGWNEEIAANGTVNFGFNANYSGVGSLQFTGADFTFA
ncbi:MAG: putative Ig domain-containing protein, partial [Novosphingobium sp.]